MISEVLLVIVNNPKYELKSALLVETLLAVQYKIVPLSTRVVTTLNVKLLPSFMLVTPPFAATEYVGDGLGEPPPIPGVICIPPLILMPPPKIIAIIYLPCLYMTI
jgi:hypothetical protein